MRPAYLFYFFSRRKPFSDRDRMIETLPAIPEEACRRELTYTYASFENDKNPAGNGRA
jgi:hypothetical protein